eukprot:scaffold7415_cov170-Amphora_coffeaeformis.AAC.2
MVLSVIIVPVDLRLDNIIGPSRNRAKRQPCRLQPEDDSAKQLLVLLWAVFRRKQLDFSAQHSGRHARQFSRRTYLNIIWDPYESKSFKVCYNLLLSMLWWWIGWRCRACWVVPWSQEILGVTIDRDATKKGDTPDFHGDVESRRSDLVASPSPRKATHSIHGLFAYHHANADYSSFLEDGVASCCSHEGLEEAQKSIASITAGTIPI